MLVPDPLALRWLVNLMWIQSSLSQISISILPLTRPHGKHVLTEPVSRRPCLSRSRLQLVYPSHSTSPTFVFPRFRHVLHIPILSIEIDCLAAYHAVTGPRSVVTGPCWCPCWMSEDRRQISECDMTQTCPQSPNTA